MRYNIIDCKESDLKDLYDGSARLTVAKKMMDETHNLFELGLLEFVDKGNLLYIMYNEKDNTDCMIAKEICVRSIYNEQELRDYLKYVMDNGYSFRIGLKNRKRIKK